MHEKMKQMEKVSEKKNYAITLLFIHLRRLTHFSIFVKNTIFQCLLWLNQMLILHIYVQIIKDKDTTINKQRTDLTNLRKKNFDFRSRITELEDKARNDNSGGGRQASRNPRAERRQGGGLDTRANEAAIVMQMQRQEMRERENQMIMMTMMESMQGATGVEAEEQRLLQQAIEASRGEGDPNNPNTDNMTYEELLQLEDRNGKVSKGLTPAQIRGIKEQTWMKKGDTSEDACSICFDNFERG